MIKNQNSKKENYLYSLNEYSLIDMTSESLDYDDLFFTKLIVSSFDIQNIDFKEHFFPALYLIGIMESYAKNSTDYMSIDEYVSDLIKRTDDDDSDIKQRKIRFADNVVFFSGLYPETFTNSLKSPSFYISTARSFYFDATDFKEEVYFNLASNIKTYIRILRQTREIIKKLEPDSNKKLYLNELN